MAFTFSSKFPNPICSIRPKIPQISAVNRREIPIPARDRVVDFGKYRGKMLGALPSSYLKWVSKNLRAGDSMHWAILADQVLQDPVYQDRIEWEFADLVLNGNRNSASSSGGESAVSQLVEVSERFGWDNEDKTGWSRVNFELLGTSKGGRIPRLAARDGGGSPERRREAEDRVLSEGEMRRKERRERRAKLKKVEERGDKLGIIKKYEEGIVKEGKLEGLHVKRFPGRESLLNKVISSKQK